MYLPGILLLALVPLLAEGVHPVGEEHVELPKEPLEVVLVQFKLASPVELAHAFVLHPMHRTLLLQVFQQTQDALAEVSQVLHLDAAPLLCLQAHPHLAQKRILG